MVRFLFILSLLIPCIARAGNSVSNDLKEDIKKEVLCTYLKNMQAGGSEYVPGVDVHGESVVSADISSGIDGMDALRRLCNIPENNNVKKNQSNQEEEHGHESSNPVVSSDEITGQYP